jgi:hypothetical protein
VTVLVTLRCQRCPAKLTASAIRLDADTVAAGWRFEARGPRRECVCDRCHRKQREIAAKGAT